MRYYRNDKGDLWSESEDKYDGDIIASGYTRIGRKAWRDYKRLARIKAGIIKSHAHAEKKLAEKAMRVNYEDQMSEEPYL